MQPQPPNGSLRVRIETLERELQRTRDLLREVDRTVNDMRIPVQSLTDMSIQLGEDIRNLRSDLSSLRQLPTMSEAAVREICREIQERALGQRTDVRDGVMRLVTFAIAIGSALFVIRGGR
jgi:hypothetical protein